MSAPGPTRIATVTRDDWETPIDLFEKLDREFDFRLDGAANGGTTKCDRWLGPNGVTEDAFLWTAEFGDAQAIWVNPPYGDLMRWVTLFDNWRDAGHTVVALLPNATDAGWFRYIAITANEIRLMHKRVQFVGSTSSNPSGSVIAIWRPGPKPPAPHIWVWDWR